MTNENPTVAAPPLGNAHRPTISARTVGWVLSAATIGSLLLGLAVVGYFGRLSGRPQQELDPAPFITESSAPPKRPTVLPPMGRGGQHDQQPSDMTPLFSPAERLSNSPPDNGPRVDTASNERLGPWQ